MRLKLYQCGIFLTVLIFIEIEKPVAQTPENLSGFYRNGQIFLTWENIADNTAYYKVYRSTSPVTENTQLSSSEYLGWVNHLSARDHNLSQHDEEDVYLRLDSAGSPLTPGTGLFVSNTLEDGHYFYAVTTIDSGIENTQIIPGVNSLVESISEAVAVPQPIFQEERNIAGFDIQIYSLFYSYKKSKDAPLQSIAGFICNDFAVNLNGATGSNPLKVFLHGAGSNFLSNVSSTETNEVIVSLEELLPSAETSGYWGNNEHYDIFKQNEEQPIPDTGVNYNYYHQIMNQIIDWSALNLPVDSNRIYLQGISRGACGCFFYSIVYPEKIAATSLSVPCYNLSFLNDFNPNNLMNPGHFLRDTIDAHLGMVSTNLPSGEGLATYDVLNGGFMIHEFRERSLPLIFGLSGKRDTIVGWTEKTIYYDSVNANYAGGYYFWDNRKHNGIGKTWDDSNFNLYRYRRDRSYPAFANCSLNENYGDGHATSGAPFGTINGALNWKDEITDDVTQWKVKMFVRNLKKANGQTVFYPDSCTADVTPRRLQQFQIPAIALIHWTVTHNNQVIQSGSFQHNGGLLVIQKVKIFRDTSTLRLTYEPLYIYFEDEDNDGYGNPEVSILAQSQPAGYVSDSTDCNDNPAQSGAFVHPNATDSCNNIDDNCNGVVDENQIVASITPAGIISACPNSTVLLTANPEAGAMYQWYKNGSQIPGATNSNYSTTKKGNFTVIESNAICDDESEITTIERLGSPKATITVIGSPDICATGSALLKANKGTGFQYQWLKNNISIQGATNRKYTATSAGDYSVIVTNSSSCSKTSSAVTVFSSCRIEIPISEIPTFKIHPNPSDGNFTLELPLNPSSKEATIQVINSLGEIILEKTIVVSDGNVFTSLQMKDEVANGIYLIRAIAGAHVYSKVLVVSSE